MSRHGIDSGGTVGWRPGRARTCRRILWLLVLTFLLAAVVSAYRAAGGWLVVEDPLEHADAIVVLSGRMPYRAIEAAQLYSRGFAPEVWLTHQGGMREEMARLGLEYTDEDTYSAEVLGKLGVPASAIQVLPGDIVNTEDEVREIADELRSSSKSRVIIVTSPPHTRRVRTLWRRLVGKGPQAIIRYSRSDPFDAAHWWRHTGDSLDVVREILGLLNVWAGLPVRPSPN